MFVEKKELRRLKKELKKSKKQAYAEGTTANVLTQWRTFNKFCDKYDIHEWPSSTETLCLFAQYLAKRMRSVKSIENYLFGVVKLHLYAGEVAPSLKDFQIQLTLKGLRRRLRHRIKQAEPITPSLLLKIHKLLEFSNPKHTVFWAVLLTGFYLLLRKSNLVPINKITFNPKKQLSRKSVKIKHNKVQVIITWSKTIQFNRKKLKLNMYKIKHSPLCPVRPFQRMFEQITVGPNQPCFSCHDGGPFSYNMLQYYLRTFLAKAGVKKYTRFSAHSLRRGGLEWGYQQGLPRSFLKTLGDWKSDCFKIYLSYPRQVRDKAAKLICDSLLLYS